MSKDKRQAILNHIEIGLFKLYMEIADTKGKKRKIKMKKKIGHILKSLDHFHIKWRIPLSADLLMLVVMLEEDQAFKIPF